MSESARRRATAVPLSITTRIARERTRTSSSQRRSPNVGDRGMGRGLAAILPPPSEQAESLQQIPPDLIDPNPRQPRRRFETAELQQLAESVQARGVLQPVLVR